MLYEIHTITKMYTINAVYFEPVEEGVMFFDEEDRGIAFVPNVALNLVRENKKAREAEKLDKIMQRAPFLPNIR